MKWSADFLLCGGRLPDVRMEPPGRTGEEDDEAEAMAEQEAREIEEEIKLNRKGGR